MKGLETMFLDKIFKKITEVGEPFLKGLLGR